MPNEILLICIASHLSTWGPPGSFFKNFWPKKNLGLFITVSWGDRFWPKSKLFKPFNSVSFHWNFNLNTSLDLSYQVEENKFWLILIRLNFDPFLVILKWIIKTQGKYLSNLKMSEIRLRFSWIKSVKTYFLLLDKTNPMMYSD